MTQITIGTITLNVDLQATKQYYSDKPTFLCTCIDCQNYLRQIQNIIKAFDGLDQKLGIDLTRDVGIGSDELMPHDYDDHLLYVIPYYVIGSLISPSGNSYEVNDWIRFQIRDTNYNKTMQIKEDAFCIWLEIRLPPHEL